jgi:hypothetical protein
MLASLNIASTAHESVKRSNSISLVHTKAQANSWCWQHHSRPLCCPPSTLRAPPILILPYSSVLCPSITLDHYTAQTMQKVQCNATKSKRGCEHIPAHVSTGTRDLTTDVDRTGWSEIGRSRSGYRCSIPQLAATHAPDLLALRIRLTDKDTATAAIGQPGNVFIGIA